MYRQMETKSKCMKFNRTLLHVAGYIPIKNADLSSFYYKIISLNGSIAMILYLLLALVYVIQNKFTEAFTAFMISIAAVHLVMKHVFTNKVDLARMHDKAEDLLNCVLTDQDARDIFVPMDNLRVKFHKLFHYFILFYIPLSSAQIIMNFIFGIPIKNPFQLWQPFNSFIWSYILHVYVLTFGVFTETAYLNSVSTMTLYVTSSLKILSHRLTNQPKFISKSTERQTIKIHSDIIQLVAQMNKNYGWMFTIELLFASIESSTAGYQILIGFKNSDPNILAFIIVFVIVWSMSYIVCTCGHEIEVESDKIHRHLYYNSWYERRPEKKKTVFFTMLMTSKPLKLHYRHFITFNNAQFAAVLNSSYSAMAILKLLL